MKFQKRKHLYGKDRYEQKNKFLKICYVDVNQHIYTDKTTRRTIKSV